MIYKIIQLNVYLLALVYFSAGINHFWHPVMYNLIVPPYFPYRPFLVKLSGVIEILLGIIYLIPRYRKVASVLIILMLIVFITVHVYMIQCNGCIAPQACIPLWLAWIRLFPLQFILMWWAWKTYTWSKAN